jgi:hypothetical protein
MVSISRQAREDLDRIAEGILGWGKICLSEKEAIDYVNDLIDVCYSLEQLNYHSLASYKNHKKYGTYVYRYRRNRNTTWYVIYDFNVNRDIFVSKITNNHLTFE